MVWFTLLYVCVFCSFLSFLGLVMQPRLPALLCSCKHGFYQTHYYAMFYFNIYTMWARMVSGRDCNGEGRTREKIDKEPDLCKWRISGGAHGECPLPTDQNVLNFMQFFFFFLENLEKSYVAPPTSKGRRPLLLECWIRSCCEETVNIKRGWVETSIVVSKDPMAALSITMTLIYFRSRWKMVFFQSFSPKTDIPFISYSNLHYLWKTECGSPQFNKS